MITLAANTLHQWEKRLALTLIVSTPLLMSSVTYDSFLLPKYVWVMILAAIWLWMIVVQTQWKDLQKSAMDLPLSVLGVVFILSICMDYTSPIQIRTLLIYEVFAGLFYAFTWLWRRRFSEERTARCLLITAVILSVYALFQDYWSQAGIPDFFPTSGGVRDWRAKVIATVGNPNFLGGYLGVSLPLLIAYALRRELAFWKYALIAISLMMVVACMTTTFCVGITVGLIFAAIIGLVVMWFTRTMPAFSWVRAITLFVLLIGSNLWYTLDNPYNSHGTSLFLEAKSSPHWASGMGARNFNWRTSLIMMEENPVTGIGYGNYLHQHIHYQGINYQQFGTAHDRNYVIPVDQPHFQILETASECGVLGVIAICWVFFSWWKMAYRRIQQNNNTWFAWGAFLGILAAVGHSFSSFPFHLPATSLLIVVLSSWFFARPFVLKSEEIIVPAKRLIAASCSALFVIAVSVSLFISDRYLRLGNETQGVTSVYHLQQAVRYNPFSYHNHFILANRYVELGWYDRALAAYQTSLQYQTDLKAHEYMGRIYAMQNKLEEAIQQQKRVIELNPVFPGHYRDLIALLQKANREDEILPFEDKAQQLEEEIKIKYAQ